MVKQSPGVWCITIDHQSQHFIVNGSPACGNAKKSRFARWQVLAPDEIDRTKQCCRCKHIADDASAHFRKIGSIGGSVRSATKARAARIRERNKRKHKRACGAMC